MGGVSCLDFRQEGESNNVVYLASRHLEIDNVDTDSLPGAGVFSYFSTSQQLTAPLAENKTTWNLPDLVIIHTGNRMPLTYHRNAYGDGASKAERTELKTVSRGQEFILDCPCSIDRGALVGFAISYPKQQFAQDSHSVYERMNVPETRITAMKQLQEDLWQSTIHSMGYVEYPCVFPLATARKRAFLQYRSTMMISKK